MLGERIAMLRKAAGMSQAQLARELKISTSAMGMYEQNRREPSLATMVEMADIFGVSLTFLVTGKTETPAEAMALENILFEHTGLTKLPAGQRSGRPMSRQELATMLTALLMEP